MQVDASSTSNLDQTHLAELACVLQSGFEKGKKKVSLHLNAVTNPKIERGGNCTPSPNQARQNIIPIVQNEFNLNMFLVVVLHQLPSTTRVVFMKKLVFH